MSSWSERRANVINASSASGSSDLPRSIELGHATSVMKASHLGLNYAKRDGRWLGRKDSNLQPSDPESAALPLRHSPSARTRGRANHSKEAPGPGRYSLVMTTSGFLARPSVRTVIRIETGSGEPINLRYASSMRVLADRKSTRLNSSHTV